MHFRLLRPFCFRKVKQTDKKTICTVYADDSIAESIVSNWLARFTSGNVDLEEPEYFGWPAVVDDGQIETLTENDPCKPNTGHRRDTLHI